MRRSIAFGAARIVLLTSMATVPIVPAFGDLDGMLPGGINQPAIEYNKTLATDAVAQLNRGIQEGRIQLPFDRENGYLRSVLQALGVPLESQLLVFSKTAALAPLISPRNPRAIYFNDTVAVAWVRGSPFVEFAAEDPRQGVVFYLLPQTEAVKPLIKRTDDCLMCHDSNITAGVPGMTVRSVFPAPDGRLIRQLDSYAPDHRSPMEQRWGGWYVTGRHGQMRNMGNAMVTDHAQPRAMVTAETLHVESLEGKFNPHAYLSRHSDIVALLVFEHQMHMINLLTRVGWEVRAAAYQEPAAGNRPMNGAPGKRRHIGGRLLRDTARELVDYLLFVDEAPLDGPIQGTTAFAETFAALGPRDSKGRSLRQLDLQHRLLRYPCSYMIYVPAFDSLPPEASDAIYRRMWQILSGQEKGKKYARLSWADRQAIVEILRETKPGLPDYFGSVTR